MKPKKLGLAAASLLGAATMLGAATPAHADDVIVCTPGVCDSGHGADPLFKIETALNKVLGKWTPDQPAFNKIEGVLAKVNDKW